MSLGWGRQIDGEEKFPSDISARFLKPQMELDIHSCTCIGSFGLLQETKALRSAEGVIILMLMQRDIVLGKRGY